MPCYSTVRSFRGLESGRLSGTPRPGEDGFVRDEEIEPEMVECPECLGRGHIGTVVTSMSTRRAPCPVCHGDGVVKKEK